MTKLFTKKPLWAVVFAAAAIFAALFVACGDSTTDTAYIPQANLPIDLADDGTLLVTLFKANDTVVLVKGTGGEKSVTLTADWEVPDGKTLNLGGFEIALDSHNLIVLGSLSGLQNPEGEGATQITGSGFVVGSKAKIAAIASYVYENGAVFGYGLGNTAADDSATAGNAVAKLYYFGDYTATYASSTFTPELKETITTIIGGVSITSAVAVDMTSGTDLASITGNATLTNSDTEAEAAIDFTLPDSLDVKGGVTVNGFANLKDTTALTVGKDLTLGNKASLVSSAVHVKGNITTTNKITVATSGTLTIDGEWSPGAGVKVKGGVITEGGTADIDFASAYLPVTSERNAVFSTGGYSATNITIASTVDWGDDTYFVFTGTALEGGFDGTTSKALGLSGTASVSGTGVMTVKVDGSLTLATGAKIEVADGGAIVAEGNTSGTTKGVITITGASIVLDGANASLTLMPIANSSAAVGDGSKLVLGSTDGSHLAAQANGAKANDKLVATATGAAAFLFEGKTGDNDDLKNGGGSTDGSKYGTLEAGNAQGAVTANGKVVIKGYAGGKATISYDTVFKTKT